MRIKKALVILMLVGLLFCQLTAAQAECSHTSGVLEYYKKYHHFGSTEQHQTLTICVCASCYETVLCGHAHPGVALESHSLREKPTTYQNNGASGHTEFTGAKCVCKYEITGSRNVAHDLTVTRRTYQNNGSSGHTVTTYENCVCGYSVQSSSDAEHTLIISGSEHGTRNTHYVYYRCACGEQVTYSFYCDGNPCPTYAIPMVYSFN